MLKVLIRVFVTLFKCKAWQNKKPDVAKECVQKYLQGKNEQKDRKQFEISKVFVKLKQHNYKVKTTDSCFE